MNSENDTQRRAPGAGKRPSGGLTADSGESRRTAALAVTVTAILFATGGAAVKASSLEAWQIAGFRSLVAFVVLVALAPATRTGWTRGVWAAGLPYAGVMLLFVHANTLTTAATTTLLQASAPIYVALLSPLILGERPSSRRLMLLPVFVVGVWLLLSSGEQATSLARNPDLGRWLAAGAGLCYGLVLLALRRFEGGGRPGTALRAVACGNLIAAVLALPFSLSGPQAEAVDLAVVAYLGAVQIALAYVLLVPAMRILPAFDVSLLLLLELVASPLFAWWLHDETLTARTLAGGAVITAACLLQATPTWRRRP